MNNVATKRPRKSSKATKALWVSYEAAMLAARKASLDFAASLEAYLRSRDGDWSRFDAACVAAQAYYVAHAAAAPYHFGAIPAYSSGDVVNLTGIELLAIVRNIRGDVVSDVAVDPANPARKVVVQYHADNGIAGFYAGELRAMRRFGSPRRMPAVAA